AVGFMALNAILVTATPAAAQQGAFPDVPQNHWAYQAVTDLARRGYVQGYPNGLYQGQRTMTRYEFAMVIRRMLNTVHDLNARVNARPATTPSGTRVTQEDLNKLQALVTSFQSELAAIKTDVAKAQSQIDQLRKDVAEAKAAAAQAQETANNSYGFGPDRKFQLTGYVQARFQSARSNDKTMF